MSFSKHSMLILAGMVGVSSLVHAQTDDVKWKIKGKVRGDAVQSTIDAKTGDGDKATTKKSETFLRRAQMEFVGTKGAVDLHIKYYAEGNYLKNAFVEYNFSPACSMSFGKVDIRDMSMEWDYSTTDQYIYSMLAATKMLNPLDVTKTIDNTVSNTPGVEAKGVFGDHAIYLQVLQGTQPANTTFRSTGGLTSTLQYRGAFADNMVRTIATYSMIRTAGNKGTTSTGTALNYGNGYENRWGLGFKFVVAGSTTDIEYDAVKIMKQRDLDSSKDENMNTIVFQTRLPAMADITPYLKATIDSDKKGQDQSAGDVARNAYALGAEYAWAPNVRLHGIYIMEAFKVTKGTANAATSSLDDTKTNLSGFNLGITASI